MKTSPDRRASGDDLEVRLADYERQAAAYLATRGPGQDDWSTFAPPCAAVAPDLAAPGFVSFTGGPSRQSVSAEAPPNVSPAQAVLDGKLDESVTTVATESS